jgi:chemotaxis protein histidine kinase CheA
MKRILLNSILLSTLAGTSMLGCDRSAKDRPLKDPASVAAEKAKAEEAKKAAAKAAADKAKAEAEAAAAKKADPAGTTQTTGTGSGDTTPKVKTDAELAAEKAAADEAKRAAAKLAAEVAVANAKKAAEGEKKEDEKTEDSPPKDSPPKVDDAAPAKPDLADKKKEDEGKNALLEKQTSAKSVELSSAPNAISTAAASLVKIFVPNSASTPKSALDYVKIFNLPKKENTPISEVMAAVSKSTRVDKYLLLLGLQNCQSLKGKVADCKIYEKGFVKTGFLSTASNGDSTVITTTAGFLDGYYKSMMPQQKIKKVAELKSRLSKEIKVLVTKFVESSDGNQNYISDGTTNGTSSKVSLLSISDDTLQAILDGKYSEASVLPNKNIVTLKLSNKLDLPPLPIAKGACADITSNSQESNIISYEPKTLANGATPEKPGKNIVANSSTTPATAETIKKLKESSKSLGISFVENSEGSDLGKSLIISNATISQGVAGSPILNDRGEYYGIVSSIGSASNSGAFPVFGACLEEAASAAAASPAPK